MSDRFPDRPLLLNNISISIYNIYRYRYIISISIYTFIYVYLYSWRQPYVTLSLLSTTNATALPATSGARGTECFRRSETCEHYWYSAYQFTLSSRIYVYLYDIYIEYYMKMPIDLPFFLVINKPEQNLIALGIITSYNIILLISIRNPCRGLILIDIVN